MKFLVYALAGGTAVVAFTAMAGVSGGAPFEYETATLEEQQAWMDRQAGQMKTAARFFLPSGRGPSELNFKLEEVVTRPARREMELIVRVDVPYGAEVGTLPRREFVKRICGSYRKTQLYKHNVRMTTTMNHEKGRQLFKATVTTAQCDRFAETAAG